MERRSRSQTRRNGDLQLVGGQPTSSGGRHASSSRLPETSHGSLSLPYSRPPEQARTLSPERRDRYRASYREGGGGPTSLPPPRPDHYPTSSSVPHSNSNSYNQYNQSYPLNPARYVTQGEAAPPPRPLPPGTSSYNNNTASAPPRPEPPVSSYATHNSTSANVSPSKISNIGQGSTSDKSGGPLGPQHQVLGDFQC